MKATAVFVLLGMLLVIGCRAPGTYFVINRPFEAVRNGIEAYANGGWKEERLLTYEKPSAATNGIADLFGFSILQNMNIGGPAAETAVARRTNELAVRREYPRLAYDREGEGEKQRANFNYWTTLDVVCVETNELPGKIYKVSLVDQRPLNSLGSDWTEIEVRNSRRMGTQLRICCGLGEGSALRRMSRSKQKEAETLVSLCRSLNYVPSVERKR